jgi:hypothetical protein
MRLPTLTAALVLLTACGSGSEEGAGEVDAFCTESGVVFSELSAAFDNARDPSELPALLEQATSALQSIDPPAEIEDSWTSFSGGLQQLSESAQGLDLGTTAGQDQFTQQYDALMADTTAAQDDVDRFVSAHCPGAADSSPAG